MFGIPYEKVMIQSKLEPAQIITRLKTATSGFSWFKFPPKEKDFVGTVSSDGFRISRNIRNRNSYLPLLIGKIHANSKGAEGSQVVVIMSLHPVVIFLMLALFLYVFLTAAINAGDIEVKIFVCSGVVIFHLAMYLIGFRPEVPRAKKLLQKIFAGK